MPIVVGAHPQNPSLSILARRPDLVERLRAHDISFFIYGAGAATIPLFQLGVIQLGGTGATPPILAKAQGLSVAAFGMSPPRFERGGIVVAEASPIHSLADLRGRSIALMPVSWHTQFLAAELDAANIEWRAVNAVELTPATAKEAFFAGLLDAIVATDPLLAQIEAARPVRILGKPGAAFSNRSVYWGRQDVLRDQPRAVQALVDALAESDRRTQENPAEAATLLDGVNGTSASHWLDALKARPWGITVPDDDFLDEQQRHADVFTRFGLIDRPIDVSDTITRGYPAQAPRQS